jgi:cytochrome c oxidase subunit 2
MRAARALCLPLATIFILGAHISRPFLALAQTQSPDEEQVIKVVVQRFFYTPNEIVLEKGQPAVIEFTSIDFVHGFKIPDLNIRADLPPGKVTQVHIKPDKAGVYDFLCDNFCGGGHEGMSGRIIVKK